MLKYLLAAAAVATLAPTFVSSLALTADPQNGEKFFTANCTACHSNEPGKNKVGPSLAGVYGRQAGTAAGFKLYKGLKDAKWTWDESTLSEYLKDPPAYTKAKNNKPGAMPFKIGDAKTREDVIAYLKSISPK